MELDESMGWTYSTDPSRHKVVREHKLPLTIKARIELRFVLVDADGEIVTEHADEDVLRDMRDAITKAQEGA